MKHHAQALYDLAKEENLSSRILDELRLLKSLFSENPNYVQLLTAPNLPKQERCDLLDQAFRGKVHPYVLNFLKILTEKGYIRRFCTCCDAYRDLYHKDNGIVTVEAVSAFALTKQQMGKLTAKLETATGKRILLHCSIDPGLLGGLRLRCEGKELDGTVKTGLETIGKRLKTITL